MPRLLLDRANLLAQRDTHLGVERRERLVKEQELRLRRERTRQGDALLLAARQLIGIARPKLRQPDQRQHLSDALIGLGLRHAGDLQSKADVLRHSQVGEERIGLEDHADVALIGLQLRNVPPADDDVSGGRLFETRHHAQNGRLAAARRAEEGDEFPGFDVEIEILNHRRRAEGLADALDAEERIAHSCGLSNQRVWPDLGAKRERIWISDMHPHVIAKAMIASAAGS